MNILVLNGSPRVEQSGTMRITRAFMEGFHRDGDRVETLDVEKCTIHGCKGCFSCWATGRCVHRDDFSDSIFDQFVAADVVIWSFPLYFYALPGKLKILMDRTFLNEMAQMYIGEDGLPAHKTRHDLGNQRHIVVSSCGFYAKDQLYDAVLRQFQLAYGKNFAEAITCAQGGMLTGKGAEIVVDPYLATAKRAGDELRTQGAIRAETRARLDAPLIPQEKYMSIANSHSEWQRKPE